MLIYQQLIGQWNSEQKKFLFSTSQEKILYKGKTAIAMGGGQAAPTDQVVPTGPWQEQVPYIQRLMQEATKLYAGGAPQYPTGPLTPGVNPMIQQSAQNTVQQVGQNGEVNSGIQQGLLNTAGQANANPVSQVAGQIAPNIAGGINSLIGGQNPVQQLGQSLVPSVGNAIGQAIAGPGPEAATAPTAGFGNVDASGAINTALNSNGMNPYTDAIVRSALRGSNENFQDQILPGIRTEATMNGQPGGTRQGIAEGIASKGLMNQQTDLMARLYGQAFDVGSADRNAALGLVGQGQGTNVQSGLNTQALNTNSMLQRISQGLQGASLGRDLLTSGTDLSQQATSTGTAQAGNLLTGGNNAAMQQYFQSLGMIPNMQANNLSQQGVMNQMGLQQYGLGQAGIDAELERYFYNTLSPYNALSQYQSYISGPYGSSLPNGQPQQPAVKDPWYMPANPVTPWDKFKGLF